LHLSSREKEQKTNSPVIAKVFPLPLIIGPRGVIAGELACDMMICYGWLSDNQDTARHFTDFTGNQMSTVNFMRRQPPSDVPRTLPGQAKAVDDDHDLNKFSLKMTRTAGEVRAECSSDKLCTFFGWRFSWEVKRAASLGTRWLVRGRKD
jgi:hypothetical protein